VFKTVDRETASKIHAEHPEGTEVGKYNPLHFNEAHIPCFVRIQDDKAEKDENKRYKAPSMKYA
jgi:hypothetical protein